MYILINFLYTLNSVTFPSQFLLPFPSFCLPFRHSSNYIFFLSLLMTHRPSSSYSFSVSSLFTLTPISFSQAFLPRSPTVDSLSTFVDLLHIFILFFILRVSVVILYRHFKRLTSPMVILLSYISSMLFIFLINFLDIINLCPTTRTRTNLAPSEMTSQFVCI